MTTTSPAASVHGALAAKTSAGIGLMVLGLFVFSANDALGKWLISGTALGLLLFVRSAAALVVLAPFIRREGWRGFRAAPRPGLQLLRVVLATLEVACFYIAVIGLPLADTMTFYMAGPIYVTALSPVILGEKVDGARWLAVICGFVGVVIALNPAGSDLSWHALVAIAGSFCFALLIVTTRYLRGTSDIVLVTNQTVGALLFGAVMLPVGWAPPSALDIVLLSVLGVAAMVAHVLINRAVKLAPASVVAPFEYTMIVWAALFGYLVFHDIPSMSTLVGSGIIVASGLVIFVREKRGDLAIDPPA